MQKQKRIDFESFVFIYLAHKLRRFLQKLLTETNAGFYKTVIAGT